jgi:hypothetical protein
MRMSVTIGDTVQELTIKLPDLIAFERKFNVSWETVQEQPKLEMVVFLAWNAARRAGVTSETFDAWLDKVEDFSPIEEVPLVEPAPSSSPSRS